MIKKTALSLCSLFILASLAYAEIDFNRLFEEAEKELNPKRIKLEMLQEVLFSRLQDRAYGQGRQFLFALSINGKNSSDQKKVGVVYSSKSSQSLKNLLVNSYDFVIEEAEKKGKEGGKPFTEKTWEHCAQGSENVLRVVQNYYHRLERRALNIEGGGRVSASNDQIKVINKMKLAIAKLISQCDERIYSSTVRLVKDLNLFIKQGYEKRKRDRIALVAKRDQKKALWEQEWQKSHQEIMRAIDISVQAAQKQITILSSQKTSSPQVLPQSSPMTDPKAICYLMVEKSGTLNRQTLTDLAISILSQHVEPLKSIPNFGINPNKSCVYRFSLAESQGQISVTLNGRKASLFGDSTQIGVEGVKQALLLGLYRNQPQTRTEFCKLYPTLLKRICSGEAGFTLYPASPLLSLLDNIKLTPGMTKLITLQKDRTYKEYKQGSRRSNYLGPGKYSYTPNPGEIIMQHQKGYTGGFEEPNQEVLATLSLFFWGESLPVSFQEAGFNKEGSLSDYLSLFEKLQLTDISLEKNFDEKSRARYYLDLMLKAKTKNEPSLEIMVRFRETWTKLNNISHRTLEEKEELPFEHTLLHPVEIKIH